MPSSGWKVLRIGHGGRRYSAIMHTSGQVEYPPGVEVRPNRECGPLTVFNAEADARDFAPTPAVCGRVVIVPCRYEPAEQQKEIWIMRGGVRIMAVRRVGEFPFGTRLANRVVCE